MIQVTDELLKEMTDTIVREVKPRRIILFGSYAQLRYEPLETVDVPLDRQALRAEVQEVYDHVKAVLTLVEPRG